MKHNTKGFSDLPLAINVILKCIIEKIEFFEN
jgi:hypothetical protein